MQEIIRSQHVPHWFIPAVVGRVHEIKAKENYLISSICKSGIQYHFIREFVMTGPFFMHPK